MVGARLSYYAPGDMSVSAGGAGGTFDPDASELFEGNVTWFPAEMFSLEFAVGYTETTGHLTEPGLDIDFMDIEQIPLLLTARYHWWFRNSTMSFYGGGGIGYYLNDNSPTAAFLAGHPGSSFDADDSFGYHLAAGNENK